MRVVEGGEGEGRGPVSIFGGDRLEKFEEAIEAWGAFEEADTLGIGEHLGEFCAGDGGGESEVRPSAIEDFFGDRPAG